MELNENANLDPSQVEDMRGSRGGRGGGGFQIPMPGGGNPKSDIEIKSITVTPGA